MAKCSSLQEGMVDEGHLPGRLEEPKAGGEKWGPFCGKKVFQLKVPSLFSTTSCQVLSNIIITLHLNQENEF